jgi:hypothetical protein
VLCIKPGKRLSLRSEKPTVPRKTIGTLTLGNLNSVYTLIFLLFLYKSYSVATPKCLDPFSLEIYIRIVAFMPVLQIVSFRRAVKFLQ